MCLGTKDRYLEERGPIERNDSVNRLSKVASSQCHKSLESPATFSPPGTDLFPGYLLISKVAYFREATRKRREPPRFRR